jgi:triosephosphate isomerase (TIM)
MSPRRPIVAANWKMNLLRRDAADYCRALRSGFAAGRPAAEVLLFPPATLLTTVAGGIDGLADVACGGQDLHPEDGGAHTGDLSGAQLADAGCSWVLCGHSERRHDHGESDELVSRKAAAAFRHGLTPLICVGETRDERRAGRTFEILDRQLAAALADFEGPYELAYEPVWAIGTGETATPEIAQAAHAHLRRRLVVVAGERRAAEVRILYGGSVNPENAASLIAPPDVDGFLVGGASLDSDKFLAIIGACGAP